MQEGRSRMQEGLFGIHVRVVRMGDTKAMGGLYTKQAFSFWSKPSYLSFLLNQKTGRYLKTRTSLLVDPASSEM